MGRLFWKFFLFVWLAQLTTLIGVTGFFWWDRQQREMHWRSLRPGIEMEAGPGARPPWHSGMPSPPPHRPPSRRFPLAPIVLGLLASLVFAALLARYFSRPIRTLRTAFGAAAAGNLAVRVEAAMDARRDELADLGRDFDDMVGRLENLMDGQRRLLHDVSHELRSPLARLQAAIDLARQQPARLEKSMERIEKESVRMDRLVGELLTLSRLDTGTTGMREEEIDIFDLVSGIVADARFEARAKEVAVELAGTCEAIIRGDGELLHRAIENIARNAVKYSPPGKSVTVATGMHPEAGEVWITVTDMGPGIPASDLQAVFEPFYRGSQSHGSEGYGLGLAIAKRVVETMNGRIHGVNPAAGGFRMEIVLPIGGASSGA